MRWRERAPLHTGTGGLSQGQRHRETRSVPRPGSNLNPGLNHSVLSQGSRLAPCRAAGPEGVGLQLGSDPLAPPLRSAADSP